MNTQRYALVVRNQKGAFLSVLGTQRQLKTRHGKITPAFHKLLTSLFKLVEGAACIAIVEWQEGIKAKEAEPLVVARCTSVPGQIVYTSLGEKEVHG